jgi:hypothetical protein
MANNVRTISSKVLKYGLNYFVGKALGIVLLNDSGDGGIPITTGVTGVIGTSHSTGAAEWANLDIQDTVQFFDESINNQVALKFPIVNAQDTTIDVSNTSDPIAKFFGIVSLADSNGNPTYQDNNIDFTNENTEFLIVFELNTQLTLNSGSKFNFTSLVITAAL